MIGLLTYSFTSKSKQIRNLSEKILNLIFAGFGILLLYNIYKFKDFYKGAINCFFATLADTLKNTVDGIVLFTVSGVISKSNPIIILFSIISYVSFGTIFIYGDVLSRKLFGGIHSKNLEVFVKMGITILIILPGLIISIIIMVLSKENVTMQYFSYVVLILYNIFASGLILFLSKGIFETLEMN